jgi:kinesin family protein 11
LFAAFRAKNIRNRPEVNQKLSKREVIVEYTSEIRDLKTQLEAMRRQNGVYLPVEKFTSMEEDIKTSHEKIQELEDLIERKTREMEEQLELFNKTSAQLDRTEKKLQDTEDDLKLTTNTLKTTENILEATKETLEEHKYFVQEHETTEGKFHQEANELLGTINESVLDVDALHAKIGMDELRVTVAIVPVETNMIFPH